MAEQYFTYIIIPQRFLCCNSEFQIAERFSLIFLYSVEISLERERSAELEEEIHQRKRADNERDDGHSDVCFSA